MPNVPIPPTTLQPFKAYDLVRSALLEINILSGTEAPNGSLGAWGLEKLQRLIDRLNAIREAIYNVNFSLFTMTANHTPHTIGPGGDFDVTTRPTKIVSAAFILNSGSQQVDMPINVRDDQWWADNPVKSLTSSISTDLYYSPDVALGNAYFWPICNIANPVRLEMWMSLVVPLKLDTQLNFPQGYWEAIVTSLAAEMCERFGRQPSPTLATRQKEAMRAIIGNNAKPPRIRTDNSMPSSGGSGRPDFDFLTGLNDN